MKVKALTLTLAVAGLLLAGCNGGTPSSSSEQSGGTSSSSEAHVHSFSIVKHDDDHHWLECSCGEKSEIEEHDLHVVSTEEATCEHGEISHLACECGFETLFDDELKAPHKFKAGLRVEPTCQENGKQEFVCESCGEKFVETLRDINAHKWAVVKEEDGIIHYGCSVVGCTATKKVISAVTKEETSVSGQTLKETGEIALKNATIAMDQAIKDSLGESVTISAKNKTVTEIPNVKEETKELLKETSVVDLSLDNNGAKMSQFEGTMTVSLPYTLKDGDDPECLSILYLNEFGGTENIEGKYSDGKVTFETTHFSYYAVVKIAKEDLCATFGHHHVVCDHEDSTCVKVGHINSVCSRCNNQKIEYLPLVEHAYEYAGSVDSTETTHGYIAYKCKDCGDETRTELPLKEKEPMGFLGSLLTSVASGSTIVNFNTEIDESLITGESFLIRDDEGEPLIAFSESMGENDTQRGVVHNNFTYSISTSPYYGTHFSKGAITDGSFGIVATILNAISSLPKSGIKILDFLSDTLGRIAFDKVEKEGLIEVSLSWDKIKATSEALNTLKLKPGVDYIFGEGAYDFLMNVKDKFYVGTIRDVIKLVEDLGLNLKELYDFVKLFIGMELPEYEDIITEEMLDSNLYTMLTQALRLPIPPKETVDGMIDQFKDMTIFATVETFLGMGEGMKIFDMLKEYINEFSKLISFSLKCTKTGAIVDGSFELDNAEGSSSIIPEAIVKGSITSAFEREAKLDEALSTMEEIDSYCEKIKIDDKASLLVKILNEQCPGFDFEFRNDFAGFTNTIVSKEGTYKVWDRNPGTNEMIEVNKVGRIVIALGDRVFNNTYGEIIKDVTNYFGEGLDAEFIVGNYYLNSSLRYGDGIGFVQSENNEPFDLAEKYFDLSTIYASVDSDKVFSTSANLNSRLYKLSPITQAQYIELCAKTGIGGGIKPAEYNFFRGVDAFTGDILPVAVYKYYKSTNNGDLIFSGMNEEAKSAKLSFEQDLETLVDTFMIDDRHIGCAKYEWNEESNEDILVGYDETVTAGNVKIEVTFKAGSHTCELIKTNKVYVDNELVYESSALLHDTWHTNKVEISTLVEGCYTVTRYARVCEICGQTLGYENSSDSHHTWNTNPTYYAIKTLTQEGLGLRECNVCHVENVFRDSPCEHGWWEVDGKTQHVICGQCGADLGENPSPLVVEDLTGKYVKYGDDIVIGVMGIMGNDFYPYSGEWTIKVCASYTKDGEPVFLEESMQEEVMCIQNNVSITPNSGTSIGVIVITDKDVMKDFIESYVDEDLKVTFVFINNYNPEMQVAFFLD